MKRIILLVSIYFLTTTLGIAQTSLDTVFFKNGKMITGSILEQIPNKMIKIKTTNLGIRTYNVNDIKRIGYKIKKEKNEELVFLKTGEVIKGVIVEKTYNKSIKIQTERLGLLTYQDNEIDSINEFIKPENIEQSVILKSGEIIKGFITEKNPGNYIKLKTKNYGTLTFTMGDIERIENVIKEENFPESNIYLTNGVVIRGIIILNSENLIKIKTKKYGVISLNTNEIQKIEEIKNIEAIVVEKKDSIITKSDKNTSQNSPFIKLYYTKTKKHIKFHEINAIVTSGAVFSNNIYNLTQAGICLTVFKITKFSIAPEFRIGIATNINCNNTALNFTPLLLKYDLTTKTRLEFGPDVYIRMFKNGSITKGGIIAGVNHRVSQKIFIGFRSIYYNYPFIGLVCGFTF